MPNACPKCHRENPAGAETCAGCGLIFANYNPNAGMQLRADRAARQAGAARHRNAIMLVGALLLAGVAGAAWWTSRPDPYAFVAPADATRRIFSGQAQDYAGPGAELRLVDVDGSERVVGRLESGGRFRFELPAEVAPLALPSWLAETAPAGDPAQWNAAQRRYAEFRKTPMFRNSAALRGLGAGDGWRELTMAPEDLVASRFGVIYVGAGERGDLIASNTDHQGISMPGDQMLVLVHANRAGRISGVAERLNAFGAEVGNPWTLDLQAGWNLVLSRQQDDLMTLEYVSEPLPRDLQWRTLDPRTLRAN